MKHLLWKLWKPSSLVLESFVRVLSTANACHLFNKHKRFLGYVLYRGNVGNRRQGLWKCKFMLVSCQMTSNIWKVGGNWWDLRRGSWVFWKADSWSKDWAARGICGLERVQRFWEHVATYLLALHSDYSMFNQALHLTCCSWSKVCRTEVEILYVSGLLSHSCSATRVGVMSSKPEHKMVWMGCCAGVQFGSKMMIGYKNGTLMYANLDGDRFG